jgi:cytochrome c-type biogenesis protein CcmE
MNPIRKKRIYSILFVLLFSISGISLILYSLNSNLDYFFTPTELKDRNIPADKRIKVGGMVLSGSVERISSSISFVITDYENSIKVEYEGIVPDLFKEDSGVVVLGNLRDKILYAEEVLAKHDENYMPPNIEINDDN